MDLRCALMLTLMFFSLFKTQLTKGQRYRFSLIINELKNAEVVPYMTTCLAFINTILIATEDFEERVRLRNEFAGEKKRLVLRSRQRKIPWGKKSRIWGRHEALRNVSQDWLRKLYTNNGNNGP